MALMIPHKPFDTRSEGERAVFSALETGLDENYIVFHSVTWIASTLKSQGEADFLILHKDLGILVLEVKSGNIRCEARRWYQQNRLTMEEHEISDPLGQADNSKFKFIELLRGANPSVRNCLVGHAVWYPSIHWAFPLPPHYAPEILFDAGTITDPQPAIEAAFNYWGNSLFKSTYTKAVFDQVKFLIAPTFSAVPSVRANFDSRERLFISLTREQARIMDFLEEQRTAVISGSAGTGKTMLGLEKANRLGVKNEQTLFLCFNEALKKHLEDNNPIPAVHFKTIYDLADQFISYDIKTSLNDLTDQLSEHLITAKKHWPYTNVIIDEAQDFNSFFIEVLQDITEGSFYAFYDKNQRIYQQDAMDWAQNADCKLTLHTNCRNTKEIARTSARNIGLDSKTFINSPVKGEQSFIAEYRSGPEGLAMVEKIIAHLLKDKQARPEDIVVLTMAGMEDTILKGVTKLAGYPVSRFLQKAKICFNTVDDFKGLEAGYLVLADVEVAGYAVNHYRNRLYIGCSRAKQGLYLLLNKPEENDFAIAVQAIETKKKIKKTRASFYQKLAVTELPI